MSKLYTRIIWQDLPPLNTNLLWMKDNTLMYFDAGEWIPLIGSNGSGDAANINNNIRAILDQLIKLKSEVSTNTEKIDSIDTEVDNINDKVNNINSLNVEIVDELPTDPVRGTIYFIKNLASTEDNNIYDEYIYIESTATWEKLGSFVTKTDLSNYITTQALSDTLKSYYKVTEVDNKLKNYTTTSTLNSTLSSYVTTTSLNTKLKDYSTTSQINNKLNDYVTKTSLNSTLGSYVTSSTLNNLLEEYAAKSSLDDYVKTTVLNTKLGDYVTVSSHSNDLKNYLTVSKYNTDKSTFATVTALNTTNTTATEAKTLATTANNKATTNASSITTLTNKVNDLPITITGTGNKYLADNGEYKTIATYTLPAATSSTLGGVKIGSNITNNSGTISITKTNITTALGYTPLSLDSSKVWLTHGTVKGMIETTTGAWWYPTVEAEIEFTASEVKNAIEGFREGRAIMTYGPEISEGSSARYTQWYMAKDLYMSNGMNINTVILYCRVSDNVLGRLIIDRSCTGTYKLIDSSTPIATEEVTGTIKLGYITSGKNYAIKVDANGNAYVNVPWENTHNTVTNKAATLAWNTTSTVATVGNTDITIKLPANPNTDTHYTTRLYTGASGATANAVVTNPYLAVTDNNTYRNQVRFIGAGATTIASDTSGNITITSTKYSNATTTAAGLMSNTDKSKLDNITWKIIR